MTNVRELLTYLIERNSQNPEANDNEIVYQVVSKLMLTHGVIIKRCAAVIKTGCLEEVADELFLTGISWGRIISFFAFTTEMAKLNSKEEVLDSSVSYFEEHLAECWNGFT